MTLRSYIAILALPIFLLGSLGDAGEPFWRAKEKIYQRICNENEIVVSVTSEALSGVAKKNRLSMAGGGHVAVPLSYAFERSMDFEALLKMSEYVKVAEYDSQAKKLKMIVAAYGHEVHMDLLVSTREAPAQKSIDFSVISGVLTGLKGSVNLHEFNARKTETGYAATFDYDVLPIPKLFVEFGLEVVMKRMAFRIRRNMETDFQQVQAKAKEIANAR